MGHHRALRGATDGNNAGVPRHILHGRLPYGADFVKHVPFMISELAKWLGVPPSALDCSEESCKLVDRAVEQYGPKRCWEDPQIVGGLVAYIGEIYRIAKEGHWVTCYDEGQDVWEPWIVDASGRRYNPFVGLYDVLCDSAYDEHDPEHLTGPFSMAVHSESVGRLPGSRGAEDRMT